MPYVAEGGKMAKITYTQKLANKQLCSMIIIFSILLLIFFFIGFFFAVYSYYVILGMLIILIAEVAMYSIFPKRISNYKRYYHGAKGERHIKSYLGKLEDSHIVVNDIKFPWSKGNIDHIVIGRNGIFLIETKSHEGTIICNGDDWEKKKKTKGGGAYLNVIGSPSRQVRGYTYELKAFFREYFPKLSNRWINAIVIFENEKAKLEKKNEPKECKVFDKPEELINFIRDYKLESDIELSKEEIYDLKKKLEDFSQT